MVNGCCPKSTKTAPSALRASLAGVGRVTLAVASVVGPALAFFGADAGRAIIGYVGAIMAIELALGLRLVMAIRVLFGVTSPFI